MWVYCRDRNAQRPDTIKLKAHLHVHPKAHSMVQGIECVLSIGTRPQEFGTVEYQARAPVFSKPPPALLPHG